MNLNLPNTLTKFILFFIRKYKIGILIMIFITFIYSLDLVIRPYLLKMIIDLIAQGQPFETYSLQLNLLIFYYIFSFLSVNTALRIRDYIELKIFPQLKSNIIVAVVSYIESLPFKYFHANSPGSLAGKLFNLDAGVEQIVKILINSFLPKILFTIIISFLLYKTNYTLTFVVLSWSVIFLSISIALAKRNKNLAVVVSQRRSEFVTLVNDSITNIVNVMLFGRQAHEKALMQQQACKLIEADSHAQKIRIYVYSLQNILTLLLISTLIFLLFHLHKNGLITIGDFALIISLSFNIADSMYSLAIDCVNFSNHVGASDHALSSIRHTSLTTDDKADEFKYKEGKIEFRDVTFGYREDKILLNKQSLTIFPGQKIGLAGKSGSGKTTFANLAAALFSPLSGGIFIDGQDTRKISHHGLRENIGFIPQEKLLFNRTVLENIKYGKLNSSADEVMAAAKQASAHEFIMALPEGYNTLIENRGNTFSAGQKQRIIIARAIIKDAPILIMDEATNCLDSKTEEATLENIKKVMPDKTMFIISHNLSTFLHMDRILVFGDGGIVEDGTHSDLMQLKGEYYNLIHQTKKYSNYLE